MPIELKMQTKTFHTVKYYDLETFIQETFNRPDYSFAADQECPNDSTHTLHVGPQLWGRGLSEYESHLVTDFREGKYVPMVTSYLLQFLFEAGTIPAGDYLVEVSW